MDASVVIALVSLTAAIASGMIAFFSARSGGAAMENIAKAASTLVEPLEKRIDAMEHAIAEKELQIKMLQKALDEERKKRRDLELRVETLEDEKAGLISENGRLKAQLARRETKKDSL